MATIQNGTLTGTPLGGFDKVYIKKDDIIVGENLLGSSIGPFSGSVPTSSYTDFKSWGGITVSANQVYYASFEAKADVEGMILTNYFYNNSSGIVQIGSVTNSSLTNGGTSSDGCNYLSLTTEYKKYWIKYTFNSTTTSANKTLLFRLIYSNNTSYTGKTAYIKNIKLELGSTASPWTPAPSDTLYTQFGFSSAATTLTAPVEAVDFIEK